MSSTQQNSTVVKQERKKIVLTDAQKIDCAENFFCYAVKTETCSKEGCGHTFTKKINKHRHYAGGCGKSAKKAIYNAQQRASKGIGGGVVATTTAVKQMEEKGTMEQKLAVFGIKIDFTAAIAALFEDSITLEQFEFNFPDFGTKGWKRGAITELLGEETVKVVSKTIVETTSPYLPKKQETLQEEDSTEESLREHLKKMEASEEKMGLMFDGWDFNSSGEESGQEE